MVVLLGGTGVDGSNDTAEQSKNAAAIKPPDTSAVSGSSAGLSDITAATSPRGVCYIFSANKACKLDSSSYQ